MFRRLPPAALSCSWWRGALIRGLPFKASVQRPVRAPRCPPPPHRGPSRGQPVPRRPRPAAVRRGRASAVPRCRVGPRGMSRSPSSSRGGALANNSLRAEFLKFEACFFFRVLLITRAIFHSVGPVVVFFWLATVSPVSGPGSYHTAGAWAGSPLPGALTPARAPAPWVNLWDRTTPSVPSPFAS